MKSYQSNRIAALTTVLTMLAMIHGGCRHAQENRPAEQDVPADFKIIFGQQGTFAGRGMGYSINRSGEVLRWEGKYPEENIEASATLEDAHVRRLWNHARDIGFLEMQDQVMALVYNFITVTAGGESRRVTWVERDEEALTPAQRFYDECMTVARSSLGEVGSAGG